MATLSIEHNVKDFKTWKAAYEANLSLRQKHKLSTGRVYQRADNPNAVCVIFEAPTANIQAFVGDPALKTAMQGAGVMGEPVINIMDKPVARVSAI